MLVLVTYDVNTESKEGRKRLRDIAKQCQNYGQRVQNSVFECQVDSAQLLLLETKLLKIANLEKDSLRFYVLGAKFKGKVKHFGIKPSLDVTDPLVF